MEAIWASMERGMLQKRKRYEVVSDGLDLGGKKGFCGLGGGGIRGSVTRG